MARRSRACVDVRDDLCKIGSVEFRQVAHKKVRNKILPPLVKRLRECRRDRKDNTKPLDVVRSMCLSLSRNSRRSDTRYIWPPFLKSLMTPAGQELRSESLSTLLSLKI